MKKSAKVLPKLRTYNLISEFSTDKSYLSKPLSFVQRKFLAKLRLGVLPIRIETGRFERPRKEAADRICKQCPNNSPETEVHFLIECPRHTQLRATFFSKISDENFTSLSDIEKLKFLVNCPEIAKLTAQFVIDAFDNRISD